MIICAQECHCAYTSPKDPDNSKSIYFFAKLGNVVRIAYHGKYCIIFEHPVVLINKFLLLDRNRRLLMSSQN